MGVEYSDELHHLFAAQWAHLTLEQFEDLDGVQQSRIVAAYECRMQIDAIVAYEQMKKAIRESRRG